MILALALALFPALLSAQELTDCLSCPLGVCNLSLGVSSAQNGLSVSAKWTPSSTLWSTSVPIAYTCPPQNAPLCIGDPNSEPSSPDGYYAWSNVTCSWVFHYLGQHTPIIIDTDGSGFHLTSAADGIKWDFYADKRPIQIAWTAPGSTNGWLALPWKGQILSAQQLFSNVSAQAETDDSKMNGFQSLKILDTNNDGVIDAKDVPWWGMLRVWIDGNHDGIAQPNEMVTLDSLGITGISTASTSSPKTDQFGNQFKLKGRLTTKPGDNVKRVIYDVTLVAK
jgi:hypothetical protein